MSLDVVGIAKYHSWAEAKIRKIVKELGDQQFEELIPNTKRSVKSLVQHFWFSYEQCFRPLTPKAAKQISIESKQKSREELLRDWEKVSLKFQSWVLEIKDEQEIDTSVFGGPGKLKLTRMEFLNSITDHLSYHRGQLTTYLKIVANKSINTDYFSFLMESRFKFS